jgi:hypothetical protein
MRLALLLLLAASGCSSDFIEVFVEGNDFDLTVSPIDVQVAVAGGGRGTSFAYTDKLAPPRPGIANLPYSNFILQLGTGAGATVDVRVNVPAGTGWGGDTRQPVPGNGRQVHIPLSPSEQTIATTRIVDGDGRSSSTFSTGLVFAWAHAEGVGLRIVRDPDSPLGRESVLPGTDARATKVRVASRPSSTGFGPDLFAVMWRGGDGTVSMRAFTQAAMDNPALSLGPGQDGHVACAIKGGKYDVVGAVLQNGAVTGQLTDAAGAVIGAPFVLVPSSDPVEALLGVVTVPDFSIVAATRTQTVSKLSRVAPDGSGLQERVLDGDVRAFAASADGTRLLVAIAVPAGAPQSLQLVSYFSTTLEPAGDEVEVTPFSFASGGLTSQVSLSDCLIVWPEERADGTHVVDLRFSYLDTNGHLIGDSHLINADLNGDHFSPTAVCESATRAYVTFVNRTDPDSALGGLRSRRVPSPSLP